MSSPFFYFILTKEKKRIQINYEVFILREKFLVIYNFLTKLTKNGRKTHTCSFKWISFFYKDI